MGKKSKKEKKPSPWDNVPVTPYEKTLPLSKQAKMDPVLKEALKTRKLNNGMEKLVTSSAGKAKGRIQYAPVQEEIPLNVHTPDGKTETVIVKVKTKRMKKITHRK